MHERFFSHGGSALSSILRNTVNRMGNSYVVQGGRSDSWRHAFGGRGGAGGPSSATSALLASANSLKFKGRQLLDQEGTLRLKSLWPLFSVCYKTTLNTGGVPRARADPQT